VRRCPGSLLPGLFSSSWPRASWVRKTAGGAVGGVNDDRHRATHEAALISAATRRSRYRVRFTPKERTWSGSGERSASCHEPT
jgi:hypothetical protein